MLEAQRLNTRRLPSPLAGEGQGEGKNEGRGSSLPLTPALSRKGRGSPASYPRAGGRGYAARLFRAAEKQAKKLERSLAWDFQRKEDRALDLAALRELTRILRDLSVVEESARSAGRRERRERSVEHEQALAVEGRAVVICRTKVE